MFLADLTYEEACKRHPEQVKKLIHTLRNSSSRSKNEDVTNIKWHYETCLLIDGHEPITFDERVKHRIKNTTTTLAAKVGRWRGEEIVPNPPELRDQVEQFFRDQETEKRRFSALSEEEKTKEFNDAVSQLAKKAGFFILKSK